jgi:LacI family gluconate utilization system Gnt-I transcriptional repressor
MKSTPLPLALRATGRVTLADVARLAEVSPITVSRAIRGERAVDPNWSSASRPPPEAGLRARPRRARAGLAPRLARGGADPDAVEQSLRRCAGSRAADAAPLGYQTLIGITHYDAAEEEQLLREQLQHRPAGVLLTGLDRSESTRALLRDSGVPCVHMMETTQEPGVYSVGLSQADAAAAMVEPPAGARPPAHRLCRRAAGPAHAAAAAGLAPAHAGRRAARSHAGVAEPGAFVAGGGRPHVRADHRPDAAVDAIFFCNDDLAQGALLAAARLGVPVPQRVAVAGFNDLTGNDQMQPPLTTVRTPRADRRAAMGASRGPHADRADPRRNAHTGQHRSGL